MCEWVSEWVGELADALCFDRALGVLCMHREAERHLQNSLRGRAIHSAETKPYFPPDISFAVTIFPFVSCIHATLHYGGSHALCTRFDVHAHAYYISTHLISTQLNSTDMRREDVDEVVLVGGTTRIPRVKRELRCVCARSVL